MTLITHLLRDRVSLSSLGWLISYGERAVAQALDTLERGMMTTITRDLELIRGASEMGTNN